MTHAEETGGLPSASSGERLYSCHGSWALEAEAPEDIPSTESQQGTEIHQALEQGDFSELDEQGRTIAERLVLLQQNALEAWERHTVPGEVQITREERHWIRDRKTRALAGSAKLDVMWMSDTRALIIDLKTGYLPVTPAYRNIQARIQAIALWHEYPRLETIRAGFASYRFKGKIDTVDYDRDALQRAEQEFFFHRWMAQQPHASFSAGPWCRWCRAKSFCATYANAATLAIVHTGSTPLTKQDAEAVAYKLTLPQMAFIRLRKTMLTNFMAAVDDRLDKCSDEELAAVGLRRQGTGSLPACDDILKLWGLLHAAGVTVDEWQSCLQPQLGKIQDILVEKITKATGCTKDDAKASAKKLMAPAIKQQPKQPTLKAIKGEKTEE